MKKLLATGFLIAIFVMFSISIFSLHMAQGILTTFAEENRHFKTIATAATEASSYAKRAEGHLLLYLALHRPADRNKYPERIASLLEQLRILDQRIQHPEARDLLATLQGTSGQLLSGGNALIAAHDAALAQAGAFDMTAHQEAILSLHEDFSNIRKMGVQLATFEIHLESRLVQAAIRNAKRLRTYLIGLMIVASWFTVYLGLVLNRMIHALQTESRRREEALANVRVLSGLLPICMSCKKIRDDKGYWNQIEGYIREHSDAEFSHGMCPECIRKLYPEYADTLPQTPPVSPLVKESVR